MPSVVPYISEGLVSSLSEYDVLSTVTKLCVVPFATGNGVVSPDAK